MMGSRQLIVFGVALACVKLSDARFLSMTVPTYWGGVEEQTRAEAEAEPAAGPERWPSRESAPRAGRLQAMQKWPEVKSLSWKFPKDPVDPVNEPPVDFEPRRPAADRVAVRCGESWIQVEASQDLLGLGKLIKPEEITLGGCSATEVDDLSHVLIFEYELHGCGSTLVMTENSFIYAFTLVYDPKVSGRSDIIRSQSAAIGVECHYPR